MSILGNVAEAATGTILGMATGKMQDERQLKQQGKLQEQQIRGNKEMADYQHGLQYDMWKRTNYGAQVDELNAAGLNPALLYGGGGGGGATTGSGAGGTVGGASASDPVSGQRSMMEMGMMMAQKKVLESQAAKNEAEAEKISGVDTNESVERTKGTSFQNEVNSLISAMGIARNYQWAADKVQVESEKANADWETYKASGYEGRTFDDKNSPLAKAMGAGLKKTMVELENAKTEGNIKKLEEIIKRFEAGMAEQGISPNSPWGVKLVADILDKIGLNPLKK